MKKYWIVTVGLLAFLTACTSMTPAAPGASAPPLDGTSWTVTAIGGTATIAGHQPTIAFAGDRAYGMASCNQFNAGFSQSGSTVKLSPGALTAMACTPEAVMTQEQAFTAALATVAGVRSAGTAAELLDTAGTVVLALDPTPAETPKPLTGTEWQLSAILAKAATSSPVAGSTVTLQITGDQLSGKACNTFRGQVKIDGTTFTAGPLMSTKMACANPDESAQETAVLAAIEAAATYSIVGNTLTLKADDGTGLEFRAA